MALAIAAGVPPQHGLYTAIVAGVGDRAARRLARPGHGPDRRVRRDPGADRRPRFGLGGLLLATLMAGVLLVVLGRGGLGRLIQFVPYPVTTGFTAGIAVVIATLQLKDFLGLTVARMPAALPAKRAARSRARAPHACVPRSSAVGRDHARGAHRSGRGGRGASRRRWSRSSSARVLALVARALARRRLRRGHHRQPVHVRGRTG